MCHSIDEGGQRCAAATRPAYAQLIAAIDNADGRGLQADLRKKARRDFEAKIECHSSDHNAAPEALNALQTASAHASTRTGLKEITADIERYQDEGDRQTAAMLIAARKRGGSHAEAAKAIRTELRKEREKAERKRNNSSGELRRSKNATETHNMAAKHPGVAEMWDLEANKGIRPEEITPKQNEDIHLVCPQGHRFSGRANNITNNMEKYGRDRPSCPECNGRRARQFQATQERLNDLAVAVDDPKAFDNLTPAIRMQVLGQLGYLDRGGEATRSMAMGMISGDVTFEEVMRAKKWSDISDRLSEADEEQMLSEISDFDAPAAFLDDADRDTRIARTMSAAGVEAIIDDPDLAAHIHRENLEALWNEAYDQPEDLDSIVATVRAQAERSQFAARLANDFEAQVTEVASAPLPDGFVTQRVDADGEPVVFEPTLAQRRFMTKALEERRYMNWSETGAGKTVSATLAVQASGAGETLVVGPKSVTAQWAEEFKTGFGDKVEIIEGLPDGSEPPATPGVNRIWIANYDKFQGDADQVSDRLAPLASRVDAIVYDEAHMAKSTDENSTSKRRSSLEAFTDKAGRANPNLMVLGMTATPVVNNLNEAASILRLVEGPTSRGFKTDPTPANAAAAHLRLAEAGMRHRPNYGVSLTKDEQVIDITPNLARVSARVEAMKQSSGTQRVTPAMMERALLPEKLDALSANVAAADGPTVVYTEYTTGMVDPIRARLEADGKRVAVYTGTMSLTERAETVRRFKNGEYDVLVGSRPIGTGVDGLQHVSNNMIVASMPWTSAADTQVLGRLNRRGQARDVKVTYLMTEAKVGSASWSWCRDNRMKRVKFKGDLASAAVDGVFAEGMVSGQGTGVEDAVSMLKDLRRAAATESLSKAS